MEILNAVWQWEPGMMYSIQLHWLQAAVGDLFSSAKSLDRVWDPHWLLFKE